MRKIDLRVDLKGEAAKKFLYIKEKLGLETDEDVLVYLINEAPVAEEKQKRKPQE